MIRAFSALVVTLVSVAAQAQANEVVEIIARRTNKCVAVETRQAPGPVMMFKKPSTLAQVSCQANHNDQHWRISPVSNSAVQLISAANGECITAEGDAVLMLPCNSNNRAQMWSQRQLPGGLAFISTHTHRCIDASGSGSVSLMQGQCNDLANSLFEVRTPGAPNSVFVAPRQAPPQPEPPVSAIASIAGNWRWTNGINVDIFDNGTLRGSNGQTGRWSREDATRVVINWQDGWIDRLALSADGQHLRGSNQNGGAVTGDRISGGAPPIEPYPGTQPYQNDCGAGPNDPGCSMRRASVSPMDARLFHSLVESARRQSSEPDRRTLVREFIDSRLLTAMQFGVVLNMFANELIALDMTRDIARNVVNPDRLSSHASRFRNVNNRREYETIIASLRDRRSSSPALRPTQLRQR